MSAQLPLKGGSVASAARILIVRLSAMGDIIHAMPAVAALRRARPDLEIGWLVEERWSELLAARTTDPAKSQSESQPLVDQMHAANFSAWRKSLLSDESWREMRACLREVRHRDYDLVLDLQGAIRSAWAARLSGAKVRIGSSQPREAPAAMFYTRSVGPRGNHVVEHALSLASEIAGVPLSYADPEFPRDSAAEGWAEDLLFGIAGKPIAIVNPGAGWGAKCWRTESFGTVSQALADRGMAVFVNHGPSEESLAEEVRLASGGVAQPLKPSVGELIALTRRASLFVGGDTGPMHLAAALRVPVVALFGPTRPERNGPFATPSVVLRNPESIHNTSHTHRPDAGLLAISPQSVIDAADKLLQGRSG